MTELSTIDVMDVPVSRFDSYEHALDRVRAVIESGRQEFWVAVNPQKIYRAWHDRKLMDILRHADATICDGIGVSIAAKMLHGTTINRCTGCDLFFALTSQAAKEGWSIFLLGASAQSNEGTYANLIKQYPGLKIVGRQDGYFGDSVAVIDQINRSRAHILFVAMGTPAQEYWVAEHRQELEASFCLGVGGSFDVASGASRRAPGIFRKTGTEFLYQLLTQPHKRFKRQLVYFPYMFRVVLRTMCNRVRASGSGASCQG